MPLKQGSYLKASYFGGQVYINDAPIPAAKLYGKMCYGLRFVI